MTQPSELPEPQLALPDTGVKVFAELVQGLYRGAYIQTINFHNLSHARLPEYTRQLELAAHFFSPVTEADLKTLFQTGRWHKDKPGFLPVFYEGYRNHYDLGLPLLERYGFRGWFFVPTDFLGLPAEAQHTFAAAHHIGVVDEPYDDDRIAMIWDEVRDLKRRGHIVASHTRTHAALTEASPAEALQREIVESQQALVAQLGEPAQAFAWLYGNEYQTLSTAHPYLAAAGYRYLFSNYKIQRLGRGLGAA